MPGFEVQPGSLEAAAHSLVASGSDISEVRTQATFTESCAALAGSAECDAALQTMLTTWSRELDGLSTYVVSVGSATSYAGRLYAAVDSALFGG